MADLTPLINPDVQDWTALEEFLDNIGELASTVEQDVARLKHAPEDRHVIADLFRTVHNIKGDAALCRVDLAVTVAHPIETLLTRLRAGDLLFTDLLGETILLAVDRLELAVKALAESRPLTNLRLVPLVQGLEKLGGVPSDRLEEEAARVIRDVTGFLPTGVVSPAAGRAPAASTHDKAAEDDLRFFRSLALQWEGRSPHLKGRSARTLRLALETNREAGRPVDPVQLQAAVYMHDIGMMFLPETLWLKVGALSVEEKKALQVHPGLAAGLLARMERWKPAAEMVFQHHEMPGGAGYPHGLTAERICPGAKLLAIVDAFEAVTLKHSHRGDARSALRAIAEVNACDNQFAPEWIGPFNTVIRRLIEAAPHRAAASV